MGYIPVNLVRQICYNIHRVVSSKEEVKKVKQFFSILSLTNKTDMRIFLVLLHVLLNYTHNFTASAGSRTNVCLLYD